MPAIAKIPTPPYPRRVYEGGKPMTNAVPAEAGTPKFKYKTEPEPTTGMPRCIPYIVANEFAERFSFYGMRAILVIFMTEYLQTFDGKPDRMSPDDADF